MLADGVRQMGAQHHCQVPGSGSVAEGFSSFLYLPSWAIIALARGVWVLIFVAQSGLPVQLVCVSPGAQLSWGWQTAR
jgi:hypothetical protein